MCLVYEGSRRSDFVLQVEQEIKYTRKNVENNFVGMWNKKNQMRRKYPNEETKEKGQPTEKYKKTW